MSLIEMVRVTNVPCILACNAQTVVGRQIARSGGESRLGEFGQYRLRGFEMQFGHSP